MRSGKVSAALALLVFIALAGVTGGPAKAENGGGLSTVLGELLRGSVAGETNGRSDKRVPFGREEMELSFAPLVRETAPAVVNVYASQQVKAR